MSKQNQNIKRNEYLLEPPDFPSGLIDKISALPTKPGVYLHKNSSGQIIYVGKAKNLRNRVKSYFQLNRPVDAKTKALVRKINDTEVIVVDSEAEAFILEDTLIKKHKPKYNILLRDDKTYPYIRITKEDYPRVFTTRKIIKDGSKYIGPFTDVGNINRMMKTIRSLFMLRSCDFNITQDTIEKKKHKICLDYHIKKCEGPCEGLIAKIEYNENIKRAMSILNGKTKEVLKELEEKMQSASENLEFEKAASLRNKWLALNEYSSKQKVVDTDLADRDVIGLARIDDVACTLILKIREGKLIGKRHYIIKNSLEEYDEDIIQRTVERWYIENDFIPLNIYLAAEPRDTEYLTEFLATKRENSVHIHIPKIGEKKQLIEMANKNALHIIKEFNLAIEKREQSIPRPVISLQRDLRLDKPPRRIECFDNSHIQGSELVSSMVVFENGKPKKSEYRKYKVQNVGKNDDFAAMRETIERRYTRLKKEMAEGKADVPDLIIIDGGKGQLSSAKKILDDLGLKLNVIGLAKRLEEIYFPGNSEPLMLPRTSSSLKLVQALRDESHRFAITFHRSLRDKRTLSTELTSIQGIGQLTAMKLLNQIGSVKKIKIAKDEELSVILNSKQIENLRIYFNGKNDESTQDNS